MLRLIKHPNVIEMLAAYTHKGKHNLIFPKADDQTLSVLLGQHPASGAFKSFQIVVNALSGLCSALHAIHDFKFPDLQMIGCHHDLKPDNILVHDRMLLLADFGLSSFKSLSKGSYTTFKQVRGDYVAPECEDLGDLPKQSIIGRSSDIWSLGCILLEVLTWFVWGPDGVEEFENSRVFKINNYTRHRFHHGNDTVSPTVAAQIDRIENSSLSRLEKSLNSLISDMLDLSSAKRPSASVVDAKLQQLTIKVLADKIREDIQHTFESNTSMQAWIILQKFRGWMNACNVDQVDVLDQWDLDSHPDFKNTRACLMEMSDTLATILPNYHQLSSYLYESLHHLTDKLYAALSPHLYEQARAFFRLYTFDGNDKTCLENMTMVPSVVTDEVELMVLAKVRLLADLTHNQSLVPCPELMIDPSRIKREKTILGYAPGRLFSGTDEPLGILIEQKYYVHDVTKEELAELVGRLSRITMLLREARQGFRLLECNGFFHDLENDSCGLVYRLPSPVVSHFKMRFTSLKAGLDQAYRKSFPSWFSRGCQTAL